MKKHLCVLLTFLTLLVANPAIADPVVVPSYNYVVAKLGAYFPNSNDLNGYSTGFSGEFAFGHYFNPYIAIELGVGYFETSGDVNVVTPHSQYISNEKLEVVPLTASLKFIYPINIYVEPYIIGGIGAYFVDSHIDSYGHYGGLSDNETAFGGHLGGGINFNVAPNFFIGVECKYVWLDPNLYGASVNLSGTRLTGNFGVRF